MCISSYIMGDVSGTPVSTGICFPSPDEWNLSYGFSALLNILLIFGICVFLQILNKTYNFISTTDTVLQCSVLVLICSNLYIDRSLCVSTILGAIVLIELFIIFGTYRARKAMADYFVAGTILSISSMFEYAAAPFLLALFFAGVVVKSLDFKCLCALAIGAISPYWIALGFGIIDFDSFKMPQLTTIFAYNFEESGKFVLWLNCSVTVLMFLLIALYNGVSMYAGNTKRRLLNNSILIFGLVACAGIVVDAGNMTAYLSVLYIALAAQIANLFTVQNIKYTRAVMLLLLAIYAASFVGMIYKL